MYASADQPISMGNDVAAVAGCGTTTLYAAFRQFRIHKAARRAAPHSPTARAREELQAADDEVSS